MARQIFMKRCRIKFHGNPFNRSRVVTMRTDGRMDSPSRGTRTRLTNLCTARMTECTPQNYYVQFRLFLTVEYSTSLDNNSVYSTSTTIIYFTRCVTPTSRQHFTWHISLVVYELIKDITLFYLIC